MKTNTHKKFSQKNALNKLKKNKKNLEFRRDKSKSDHKLEKATRRKSGSLSLRLSLKKSKKLKKHKNQ